MERLTPAQVHDKVMGECRMVLDSYQMQELEDFAFNADTYANGCYITRYQVIVYFVNGGKRYFEIY